MANGVAGLVFAAARPCIERSRLYDRSATPSHRRVPAPAAASSSLAAHSARNIGEDYPVTRTLVLAARVCAVVVLGGIVLASVALPLWNTFEDRAGEAALRKLGASFSEANSGGLLVELPTQISDDTLIREGPHLERLNIAHLYLPHSKFTSLEPLKGLTNLSLLTLINVTGITSLEPLKGLTNLSKLYLNDAKGIKSLEPLKELGVQIYGASDELLETMN